jgi:hypothetical protein
MRYSDEITSLTLWFKAALSSVDTIEITQQQYEYGFGSLPVNLLTICNNAFDVWLIHRKYELSYSQISIAFFTAAEAIGKLKIRN